MGCFSEEEKEEIFKRFWEQREAKAKKVEGRRERTRQAAREQEEPYRRRVLEWAVENWDLMETITRERFVVGGEFRGLFKVAFALLPDDLKTELNRTWLLEGDLDGQLGEEDRERLEVNRLYLEEKVRTGSPCPETERKRREINERESKKGRPFPTPPAGLVEANRLIVEASRVYDPLDLP